MMTVEWLARPIVDAAWRLEVLDVPWQRATCFLTQWPAIGRGVHSTHDTHLHSSSRGSGTCRESSAGCWQAGRFWTLSLGGKLRIAPCRRERLREASHKAQLCGGAPHMGCFWASKPKPRPQPRRLQPRKPAAPDNWPQINGGRQHGLLSGEVASLSTVLAFGNL